jgi:hypothetical protein
MNQNKDLSAEMLKKLEEAVTFGMGKGWTHNSGRSTRCCCPWNKHSNV